MANATQYMKKDIQSYLDNLASKDAEFAKMYANPAKNIDECLDFIVTQVKASGVAGFHDNEIYGMAMHYYEEENVGNISKGISGTCQVVTNHHIELTEEEKEAAKQKALDNITAQEERRIKEKERREKEAAKAKAEARKKELEAEGCLSLFGEE